MEGSGLAERFTKGSKSRETRRKKKKKSINADKSIKTLMDVFGRKLAK